MIVPSCERGPRGAEPLMSQQAVLAHQPQHEVRTDRGCTDAE
jgi:hypothetical protein